MIYNRIVGMLRCAAYMGYKNLVLGAFGCGAFYNDARVVSDLFYKAIEEFDFDGATTNDLFSRIDFAVLSTYKQTYNFDEFYRNFGGENFYCKTVCDKEENRKPVFFWHEYEENGCFSNWYKSPFKIGTVTYQNVEQYLMAQKAKLFRDEYVYKKILKESSPAACKKLGKEVRNFDTFVWEKRRYGILYKGVKAKFSQNPELKEKLLNTRDRVIAEASPYDKIYGIGLTAKDAEIISPSRWVGKNLLGQVLMDVRKKLGHKNVFKKFLLGFNKN